MPRHRNPYANRRVPSARSRRRALTLSPRQEARAIRRLKSAANRMIAAGLAEKIAQQAG